MINPEIARTEIEGLIQRFKSLSAAERKGMNEHATRQGYILPLFRALGWNVDNVNEVSPEEKVSRGWVDFSFRLGGIPRYFLETKKASEDLDDPRWVQQAIDYAWTKSVTWALLSNFERLRVFNAEWKETDPFRAQFLEFDLDAYLSDFERLWWFSREQTALERLDHEADKVGRRIKRLPVSQHLFDDLKQWRSDLYGRLRQWNPLYSPAQIDEAVLRLLNRLIFIRTAEDREVEPQRLLPLLRELEDRHQRDRLSVKLTELFRQFDATYNSELFAPHFSEQLYCDYPPLEELIRGLYEKNFVRYNFNALEADVLGTAYEQYLGHIVTETMGETAQLAAASHVEEKRTKRKSQGIYYTPAFVTKYIVQQTVGRYLDENGYNPSRPPRILDMACGSGSFLIEAFDTLDRFVAKQRNQVYGAEDDLHDNLRRLELLQTCIFGVDKDRQAVEVAQLNLILRALHGRQKLPLLTNICEGDSLISGTPEELKAAFGENWETKKSFIWEKGFPEAMKDGGFDVIIGNPPYIRAENMPRDERDYYINSHKFETSYGRFDIHVLFLEKAIKMLKDGGRLGYIIPYAGLTQNYGMVLRKFILETCIIEKIIDLSQYKVFQDAEVATCVVVLQKESDASLRNKNPISIIRQDSYDQGIQELGHDLPQITFLKTPNYTYHLGLDKSILNLVAKIDSESVPLGDICYLITGAVLHDSKTGASKDRLISMQFRAGLKSYIEAKEINRYLPPLSTRFLEYRIGEMHRPKFRELFENEKIMIARIATDVRATIDFTNLYTDHTIDLAVRKDKLQNAESRDFKITESEANFAKEYSLHYLLGNINSRLVTWYLQNILGMAIEINPETGRNLPIHRIDFTNPAEKSAHDAIVNLVEQMLDLQKQHQQAEAAQEDSRFPLQKRIQELDNEIDAHVFDLYGLTEAEIKIVEGK